MRLSQDDSSWRASGIKRRDFRHDHDAPNPERHGKVKKYKKDTKTWCRGKEGREHVMVALDVRWGPRGKCANCGITEWNLRRKVRKGKPGPEEIKKKQEQKEFEEAFCSKEGHIWEPDEVQHSKISITEWTVNYYRNRGEEVFYDEFNGGDYYWSGNTSGWYYWKSPKDVASVCAICGRVDKTRRIALKDLWKYK